MRNDVNETQSNQEKEETEKNEIIPLGPGEHPLQHTYTFWYSSGKVTKHTFDQSLKKLGSFVSVEQFWNFYSHMQRPGDLTHPSDYHLFKQGVRPMWEDEANVQGGSWSLRLRKGIASRCWENLILAMLGEQFVVGDELCGAVISIRSRDDTLSLWHKTAEDKVSVARIRDTIKRVLNLPPNAVMKYKRFYALEEEF